VAVPDFPTECLPVQIAEFVTALAENTETPLAIGALCSLGVQATIFQSRYCVVVKPKWIESLCLFLMVVASSSELKSPVAREYMKDPLNYEMTRRELEAEEVEINRQEKRILENRMKAAEKDAANHKRKTRKDKGQEIGFTDTIGDSFVIAKEKAREYAKELASFKEHHPYRLIVGDITVEKLIDVMDQQGGCITSYSTEGGIFDAMLGRYDKNADFDVYLKAFSGDPIILDRMSGRQNNIRNPRLTMIQVVQPLIVNGIMSNPQFKGKGLTARFLYGMCDPLSKIGTRTYDKPSVPANTEDAYRQLIRRLLGNNQDTGIIRLDDDAYRLGVLTYAPYIDKKLSGEWDFDPIKSWGGKLTGTMFRIAGLLHATTVDRPTEVLVTGKTIEKAIKVTEWASIHAGIAFQAMGGDKVTEDAKYLLKRILSTGQGEISRRDLFDRCKGKFKDVEGMGPPLEKLAEMGHIKVKEKSTGGRPSKIIFVNPMSKSSKSSKSIPKQNTFATFANIALTETKNNNENTDLAEDIKDRFSAEEINAISEEEKQPLKKKKFH